MNGCAIFAPNNPGRSKDRPTGFEETRKRMGRDDDGRRLGSYVRTLLPACVAAVLAKRVELTAGWSRCVGARVGTRRRPEVGRVRLGLAQPPKAARRVQRSMHGNVLAVRRGRAEVRLAEAGGTVNHHAHRGTPGSANCMG